MKSHLKYIGVVDHKNKIHHVKFATGVNIITGKSSTGKSAMIEIFDYCFGSSEFTIPSGVITNNAQLFFIVLCIKDTFVVIGRSPTKTKVFIKEETVFPSLETLTNEYFEHSYYFDSSNFKEVLGRYYGIDIEDTDEDLEDRKHRPYNKKKGRPSVRNMTPFMLQHQNLIANKHAIFYRFDQKEKREQTIEQFKIFAGFVTQEYFITKQVLAEEERALKRFENQKKVFEEQSEQNNIKLSGLLNEYLAITGNQLFLNDKAETVLRNPANYLNRIQQIKIQTDEESDEATKQLQALKVRKNGLYAKRRSLSLKLNDISHSIDYANSYKEQLEAAPRTEEATIYLSTCPFCKNNNEHILAEANNLHQAISWLNAELIKTPYLLDSFESDKKAIGEEIKSIDYEIREVYQGINTLENITKGLNSNRDLNEQGLKVKLKIENLLESLINHNFTELDEKIKNSKKEIEKLKNILKDKFNVDNKLRQAEEFINKTMKEIGVNFEFEKSYEPINLKFSLDSFDLCHQNEKGEKIYLRSMGSGANWLYSHLTLFMALHRYFCSLDNKALLPPILFLDQPSQVYFPTSIKDTGVSFNAREIKSKEGEEEKTDEDLKAVTNLFNQLVAFCKATLEQTGIEPQIIVTDHADNLTLEAVDFETLVNGRRWRTKGFIDV
ncbi:MAG: DUF3732 domain-containing protein [Bacteroidia bacterium]